MSFEARWRSTLPHPEQATFQRVDESHPLDFYIGREPTGEWVLLLIANESRIFTSEHAAVQVHARPRQDGRCALMFRLVRTEFERLFALVCEDLVEATRSFHGQEGEVTLVMKRFNRWQRLLERNHSGLLDDTALRGLTGELIFLESQMTGPRGISGSVAAWVGPEGAERDFVFSDHVFEVKTIRTGGESVRISSAEQLDTSPIPFHLVVVRLDEANADRDPSAFTILDLVDRIRENLVADTAASEGFEEKLAAAGFIYREEYRDRSFRLQQLRHFRVDDTFPAIRRSALSPAIGQVNWELILSALEDFELPPGSN